MLDANRKELMRSQPNLVQALVQLMDSPDIKVGHLACTALRNLAMDSESQFPTPKDIYSPPLQKVVSWKLSRPMV